MFWLRQDRATHRVAALCASSFEPMFAWKPNGAIDFWNAGAERLYGFTASETIGRFRQQILKTKASRPFENMRATLGSTGIWSGELHQVRKDGREIIVDSRVQRFADGTFLEINRDVTERRKSEIAIYESEHASRWLASIVESSNDAIVSKNLDGIILSWNKAAEQVFGFTAKEAVGQPITIVIPKDRLNEEREILTRIRRGELVDHFETIRQRKDGHLIHISLTVSPVKDTDGRIIGASKVARDISVLKRDQEKIAILAREAEHRSRNVLATVQAAVKLSRADTVDGLKDAISGRIHAIANVHSLFAESRWIGADISTIAKRELAPYFERNKDQIHISGDPILLEPNAAQAVAVALHELATNAAKYGSLSVAKGKIDLQWRQKPDRKLHLLWKEVGGPAVQTPTHRGFGSRIIEQMIVQLNGEARFDWQPEGLLCRICFPAYDA